MIRATGRLLLRDFTPEDWPAVLDYQSDPLYLRYNPWSHRSAGDVQRFVQRFVDQQMDEPRTKWQLAITLPGDGRLIGNCGIRMLQDGDREAEIGYELNPAYWGRGYATEAARTMLAFGFEELRLHRVSAWCVADNVASARVLEKLGMRREGHLREKQWIKERWWDALVYGMLDREWRALTKGDV